MTKPKVLLVGAGGYADVGSALRAARSGDVVELAPGTYDGEVVIDKAVEVRPRRGAGTVTLTAATGNTLMVLADAVVRDLIVVGGGWEWAAVEVAGQGVSPRLLDCEIQAPHGVGVRVRGGARPVVTDCRVGPAAHGLRVEAAGGFYERCAFFDVALESVIALAGATPTVRECMLSGPGRQASMAIGGGTVLTLGGCEIVGGTVTAAGGGQVTVEDSAIHGGGPALEVDDDGVLHARRVRIAHTAPEGILVRGGEGVFTECRITGTHGPGVWMTAGNARFERCEAIDAEGAGFLVVGGSGKFHGCVAHNNADQGFSLYTTADLIECSSYGNGRFDGVGIHSPRPANLTVPSTPKPSVPKPKPPLVPKPKPPLVPKPKPKPKPPAPKPKPPHALRKGKVRRVGRGGYRAIGAALDAAHAGDLIEIEPGTYTEEITVEKPVTICAAGQPGSVRLRHSSLTPLWLRANATVRGIAVASEGSGTQTAYVADGSEVFFDQCTFSGLRGSDVNVIEGARATFTRCDAHGSGFSVTHDRAVVDLRDCTVTGALNALTVYDGRMELTNVAVRGGDLGFTLYSGTVTATGLTITEAKDEGIRIVDGTGTFTDCEVAGGTNDGVSIDGGTVEFDGCRAIGNRRSGFIVTGGAATFTRCTAAENRSEGFRTLAAATFTACRSFDNGTDDDTQPDGSGPHVLHAQTYAELKQAVRNASPGDTIELEPGTYRCVDQVNIPAGVEVRPVGSTGAVGLIVNFEPIVIPGSAILRNIAVYAMHQTAVVITGADNSTLLDGCEITATGATAVRVAKGATPTLRDCTIGPARKGLVARGAGGRYERCTFSAVPEPVIVSSSIGLKFVDCVVAATKGRRVAVTSKNPPSTLTLAGDSLTGIVQAGRQATIRADLES